MLDGFEKPRAFFSVGKGDSDIPIVYNGMKSGLNAATWIPWFVIPSNTVLERVVVPGSVQADNDYEDMFLNCILHEGLQDYTGVDVSGLFADEDFEEDCIEYTKWDRPAMGLTGSTGSPYTCVQGSSRGKRAALGKREDRDNVFHWEDPVVNLPGTFGYDATQPKFYKQRFDGLIAADLVIYIDDV
jgi:hypothetical protein